MHGQKDGIITAWDSGGARRTRGARNEFKICGMLVTAEESSGELRFGSRRRRRLMKRRRGATRKSILSVWGHGTCDVESAVLSRRHGIKAPTPTPRWCGLKLLAGLERRASWSNFEQAMVDDFPRAWLWARTGRMRRLFGDLGGRDYEDEAADAATQSDAFRRRRQCHGP